jgi:hypothetical protein
MVGRRVVSSHVAISFRMRRFSQAISANLASRPGKGKGLILGMEASHAILDELALSRVGR